MGIDSCKKCKHWKRYYSWDGPEIIGECGVCEDENGKLETMESYVCNKFEIPPPKHCKHPLAYRLRYGGYYCPDGCGLLSAYNGEPLSR